MVKVLGKKEYSGTFENKPYSGVKVWLAYDEDGIMGLGCDLVKVQTSNPNFAKILDIPVNTVVVPVYDKFGRLSDLVISDKNK